MTNLITKVMHNGTQYDIGGVTSVNGQTGAVTVEPGITKIFTLASTSDLTTAQEAYDRAVNGGVPILRVGTAMGLLYLGGLGSTYAKFFRVVTYGAVTSDNWLYVTGFEFTISSGSVTSITSIDNNIYLSNTAPLSSTTNQRITLVI